MYTSFRIVLNASLIEPFNNIEAGQGLKNVSGNCFDKDYQPPFQVEYQHYQLD